MICQIHPTAFLIPFTGRFEMFRLISGNLMAFCPRPTLGFLAFRVLTPVDFIGNSLQIKIYWTHGAPGSYRFRIQSDSSPVLLTSYKNVPFPNRLVVTDYTFTHGTVIADKNIGFRLQGDLADIRVLGVVVS